MTPQRTMQALRTHRSRLPAGAPNSRLAPASDSGPPKRPAIRRSLAATASRPTRNSNALRGEPLASPIQTYICWQSCAAPHEQRDLSRSRHPGKFHTGISGWSRPGTVGALGSATKDNTARSRCAVATVATEGRRSQLQVMNCRLDASDLGLVAAIRSRPRRLPQPRAIRRPRRDQSPPSRFCSVSADPKSSSLLHVTGSATEGQWSCGVRERAGAANGSVRARCSVDRQPWMRSRAGEHGREPDRTEGWHVSARPWDERREPHARPAGGRGHA
jgi:hypothetical protein